MLYRYVMRFADMRGITSLFLFLRCSSSSRLGYFLRIVLVALFLVLVVSVHRKISSAKRRWLRYSPSIFRPLFSQFSLLKILSSVDVNSLGEMVSPCRTPLFQVYFQTVTELSVYNIS